MAGNVTKINPWVIDTASATPITLDVMRLTSIRWVGATTAGHTAVITDAAGNVFWASVANAANYVESYHVRARPGCNGLVVLTLASGKLYLEFD